MRRDAQTDPQTSAEQPADPRECLACERAVRGVPGNSRGREPGPAGTPRRGRASRTSNGGRPRHNGCQRRERRSSGRASACGPLRSPHAPEHSTLRFITVRKKHASSAWRADGPPMRESEQGSIESRAGSAWLAGTRRATRREAAGADPPSPRPRRRGASALRPTRVRSSLKRRWTTRRGRRTCRLRRGPELWL